MHTTHVYCIYLYVLLKRKWVFYVVFVYILKFRLDTPRTPVHVFQDTQYLYMCEANSSVQNIIESTISEKRIGKTARITY